MKKWHKTLLVAAAILAVAVAVWRYTAPQRQVSDLYRHYEHADGIAASYIHNYPVNDAPSAVFSRQVSRHDYSQVVLGDSPDAEILAISCDSKTFAVFHTRNAAEMHAVFCYNYEEVNR